MGVLFEPEMCCGLSVHLSSLAPLGGSSDDVPLGEVYRGRKHFEGCPKVDCLEEIVSYNSDLEGENRSEATERLLPDMSLMMNLPL